MASYVLDHPFRVTSNWKADIGNLTPHIILQRAYVPFLDGQPAEMPHYGQVCSHMSFYCNFIHAQ